MYRKLAALVAGAFAVAAFALLPAAAQASTTTGFHAVFHDIGGNGCTPPIVFCGSGEVSGIGAASTVVRVTHNVPIPGTPCNDVGVIRSITLADGSGTLVSTFRGTRCPLGEGGNAFRVDFAWDDDPTASSGFFGGATGSGTGVNTTGAGGNQVVTLDGTLTLP
jgi:hypothetical protein